MASDYSDLFKPNESKKRLSQYAWDICNKCGGMCCAYNTSPISHDFSLSANMEDINLIQLKKALALHGDFKKRFQNNIMALLEHFNKKGFGRGMADFVRNHDFSLEAVVQALWKVDREIDNYNRVIIKQAPANQKSDIYSDCLLLLPDYGCVLEEYRPYTCKTAFRKCFTHLSLEDYILSNIHRGPAETIYQYLKESLDIDRERTVPVFIISSDQDFTRRVRELYNGLRQTHVPGLTYYQLALLGDFTSLPFIGVPGEIKHLIRRQDYYFQDKVKDPPVMTIIDAVKPGEGGDDYTFGLEYVICFEPE